VREYVDVLVFSKQKLSQKLSTHPKLVAFSLKIAKRVVTQKISENRGNDDG
jgi:hypothetical protein